MEGKVGRAVGAGEGTITVGLGAEVRGCCWQDSSKEAMNKSRYLLKIFIL